MKRGLVVCRAVSLAVLFALGTQTASAVSWLGRNGGYFDHPDGWENQVMPKSGDPLTFYYAQSAPITYDTMTSFTAASMNFNATGQFMFSGAFDLGKGHSLQANQVEIKKGQLVTVKSGTFGGSSSCTGHWIGWQGTGGNKIVVDGVDAVYTTGAASLQVSMGNTENGNNTIDVRCGTFVGGLRLGADSCYGSNNVMTVSGASSRYEVPAEWTVADAILVGGRADGNRIAVSGGAAFDALCSGNVYVGKRLVQDYRSDSNTLDLSSGAKGQVRGSLYVGYPAGSWPTTGNVVAVSSAASLSVDGWVVLGGNAAVQNGIRVETGATLKVSGGLKVGEYSSSCENGLQVSGGGRVDASGASAFAFGQGKRNRITVDGGMVFATNTAKGVEWRLGDDYSGENVFEVTGGGLVSLSNAMFTVGLGQHTVSNVLRITDGATVRISGDKFAKDRDNNDIVSLRIGTQGGDNNRVEVVGGTLDLNGLGIDCGHMWGWGSTGNELLVGAGGVITNVGALKVGEHESGNSLAVSNGTIRAMTVAFAAGARAAEIATSCKVSGTSSHIEASVLAIYNRHDLTFEIPAQGYAEAPFKVGSLQYDTTYGKPAVKVVADEKFVEQSGGEVPLIVSEASLPSGLASDIDWVLPPKCRLVIKDNSVSVRFPRVGLVISVW